MLHVTLEKRAEWYSAEFPKYPPVHVSTRWLYGMWLIGQNYKGSGYYGSYPPSYLKRIHAMFQDVGKVLHLFSGSVEKALWPREITLDANPEVHPDVCVDVATDLWWEPLVQEFGLFDLILADPPYTEEDAAHYGRPLVNRNKVVRACRGLVDRGGYLVWLDQVLPMYRKAFWEMIGTIGLIRSTNHRVRTVFIWEARG